MGRFLFKTEPGAFSFAALLAAGRARWDGVANAAALIHLRQVRRGDEILIYHTGDERAVVGLARAVGDPYPDPAQDDPRQVAVDVAPIRALARPVPLAFLKAQPEFKDFALVRMPRLSVMPVPDEVWDEILRLAR